jgi:hypothetical protein
VFRRLDFLHWREAIRWRVLVGLYVAAALAALVAVNADQINSRAALGLVAAVSLLVGWGTRSGWGAVVAWMMIPLALPFGYANTFNGGGDTDLMVLLAIVSAAVSTALILASAGARILYERRHASGRAGEVEGTERLRAPETDAAPSVADLRRMDDGTRPSRDRGALKKRSIRHPTGHRR